MQGYTHAEKDLLWFLKKECGLMIKELTANPAHLHSILKKFNEAGEPKKGNMNSFRQQYIHWK